MMQPRTFYTPVNGIDFYCELRGEGPAIVLVPDGCNDCGPYGKVAALLSDAFTTLTFDMRGGTRSMDPHPQKVTPKTLADDVAGIIRALDLAPASVYGCSSGGQAVLALGKYHPALVRNVMAHEAALQADVPIEDAGFVYFENFETLKQFLSDPALGSVWQIGNYDGVMCLDEACKQRIRDNKAFWTQYYLGSVDMGSYSKEDFENMPPTTFSVGTWTSAWLAQANITTAQRGNCPITWLHCGHHPERTCPQDLAQYIRTTVEQYL